MADWTQWIMRATGSGSSVQPWAGGNVHRTTDVVDHEGVFGEACDPGPDRRRRRPRATTDRGASAEAADHDARAVRDARTQAVPRRLRPAGSLFFPQVNLRALQLVDAGVALVRHVPHHRNARRIGLDDHGMQHRRRMIDAVPTVKSRAQRELDSWQLERKLSVRRHASANDEFATAQKRGRALISRTCLIVLDPEVVRQQRLSVTLPRSVIRTG
jgi:hypothetical protein